MMDFAERYLSLRSMPGGRTLSESALLPLAETAEEQVFRRGSTLFSEGEVPRFAYFLMQGRVDLIQGGQLLRTLEAPGAVGVLTLFADDEIPYAVRARDEVVVLALRAELLREVFEDDFSAMLGAARSLAQNLLASHDVAQVTTFELPARLLRARELGLVERMLIVRRFGLFGPDTLSGLTEIAQQFRERRLEPGAVLCRKGEHAAQFHLLLEGSVSDGVHEFHAPAAPVINLETFARVARRSTLEVTAKLRMLEISWETLVDVLEDHPEMLSTIIGVLARHVLALQAITERTLTAPSLSMPQVPAVSLPPRA